MIWINYSLFKLNYNLRHCSAISLTIVMLCVCTKRVCVCNNELVWKAVRLAFSCQTSAISLPFILIPWVTHKGVCKDDLKLFKYDDPKVIFFLVSLMIGERKLEVHSLREFSPVVSQVLFFVSNPVGSWNKYYLEIMISWMFLFIQIVWKLYLELVSFWLDEAHKLRHCYMLKTKITCNLSIYLSFVVYFPGFFIYQSIIKFVIIGWLMIC